MSALVEEMFSVKERPWHGLGKVIIEAPSIEEGIKLAGLDWSVDLKEVAVDGNIIKGYKAAMRSSDNSCLGVVTDQYKVLQNKDAFNFFEPFLDTDQASLETAGSLKNGKRVWILAKLNRDDMIIDEKTNDRVEKFLLLSNSHDGTAAVKVGYTPIRVVCNNTLTAAEESVDSSLIRVTHRGDVLGSLEMVRDAMVAIDASFKTTEEMYKKLASRKNIKSDDIKKYVQAVYSIQDMNKNFEDNTAITEEEISSQRKKLIARVEELFELEPVKSAWTMYNSMNYVLNHERGRSDESRYNSVWFESGKRLDKQALKVALTY